MREGTETVHQIALEFGIIYDRLPLHMEKRLTTEIYRIERKKIPSSPPPPPLAVAPRRRISNRSTDRHPCEKFFDPPPPIDISPPPDDGVELRLRLKP
jgi:hypothetical protein